jgi:hypothetical protein
MKPRPERTGRGPSSELEGQLPSVDLRPPRGEARYGTLCLGTLLPVTYRGSSFVLGLLVALAGAWYTQKGEPLAKADLRGSAAAAKRGRRLRVESDPAFKASFPHS